MKKLIFIIALCLPLLNGCSIFQKKVLPPPAAQPERVVVDPKLLEPCQSLPTLVATEMSDIAQHYITLIGMYGTCSIKQDASISTIRNLANLP